MMLNHGAVLEFTWQWRQSQMIIVSVAIKYLVSNWRILIKKILGVFSSLSAANRCAKLYVEDDLDKDLVDGEDENLWVDEESDDDDMGNEETDDDDDQFEFSWESKGEFRREGEYEFSIVTKVWVDSRAMEDAAAWFHR